MKCNFCGREVDNAVLECPYCHYQFKREAQVLNPNDRDSFEGVTIEEDGSTNDGGSKTRYQYQTKDEYTRYDQAKQQQQQRTTVNPQVKVHTMGCSSGILMTLLILGGILALFFFLLPTFIIFAAIGAVVVFFLRLFM